jgi:hypothetical protein
MGNLFSSNSEAAEASSGLKDRKNKKKSSLLVEDNRPHYQPPPIW